MLTLVIWILFQFSFGEASIHWNSEDKGQYMLRQFIELQHKLLERGAATMAAKISSQDKDLAGCRATRSGTGQIQSVIQCMKFIDREEEIAIYSPGRKQMIGDLNILCQKLVKDVDSLERIIKSMVLKGGKAKWQPCRQAAWQQVYLTAYANFEAHPMRTLSFVRKAQVSLQTNSIWATKALALAKMK